MPSRMLVTLMLAFIVAGSMNLVVTAPALAWQDQHDHSSQLPQAMQSEEQTTEYVCPMHSHIVRDEPGTCPICGMQLEPKQSVRDSTVEISASMQQNLGVVTEAAERTTLWRYLPTQGRVSWNDDRLYHVHPRVSGWVEKLAITSVGQRVEKGDLMYELYSQELVVAQQDHLQTLDTLTNLSNKDRREALQRDGRTRLKLLGMTPALINELEQSRQVRYQVPFYAPQSGVVTELPIAVGMYLQPGPAAITIAASDSLWLIADVPEQQLDWFSANSPVSVSLPQAGIENLDASIDYIYPELDMTSRTLRVRIELAGLSTNERNKLVVGQQAQIDIFGGPKRDVLAVPVSALIMTGTDNRVMVRESDNSFVQRDVHVGLVVNGQAEILHGLSEGDEVVTSGQFLLDSDASLRQRSKTPAATDHSQH